MHKLLQFVVFAAAVVVIFGAPQIAAAGNQKSILITGASTGIGRNLAETLAEGGYHVYAGARKDKDLAALDAIDNITAVKLDVTNQDQIDAAKVIGNYPYVDKSRIGIFGWSYGGFMASNCILKGNDVFKMAMAVAPVTTWRYYDSIYTERYMQTPQENASGYDENSPINFAKQLKGKYLLIHGSADDNVHLQNAMEMMSSLIQANKQFDSQIYPDCNHGIYGGMTRIQLFNKMTNYINENL